MTKTSLTHPLRIDTVAVPGTAGVIGMTLCPGKVQTGGLSGDWKRDLAVDMAAIRAWGATVIISLMEPHEFQRFGVPGVAQAVPSGILHLQLPIPDAGVPDAVWEGKWQQAGPEVRARLRRGERVLIHCRGGLGRTGLLAARLLVEFGMVPDQAIDAARKARPGAIETVEQEVYVRRQKAGSAETCDWRLGTGTCWPASGFYDFRPCRINASLAVRTSFLIRCSRLRAADWVGCGS